MLKMLFGLKIAIINRAFRKRLDEKASAMGLTAVQLRVLGPISRLGAISSEEIHQNELEQIEHVTHPAMTKMLQRLESKGFIRCMPLGTDRRYKKITCTKKVSEIYKVILDQDEEVFSELCLNLSPQQKAFFVQATDAILKNIDGN